MSIDCTEYDSKDCSQAKEETKIRSTETNPIFLLVGCWGVYCMDNENEIIEWKEVKDRNELLSRILLNILKSKREVTKHDKEIINNMTLIEKEEVLKEEEKNNNFSIFDLFERVTELYGQRSVIEGMRRFTQDNKTEALFLAGDNVYNYKLPKKKLFDMVLEGVYPSKKQYKTSSEISGQDIDKQLSEGFTECITDVKVNDIFVGVGNHDIQTCYDLNQQLNYRNTDKRYDIGLYYNVVYHCNEEKDERKGGDNPYKINFIVIDTNMFGEKLGEYEKTCNNKISFTEKDVSDQFAWIINTINSEKCDWNIIIGHVPYKANGHKKNHDTVINENLGVLFNTIQENSKTTGLNVQVYMCADEHNQQFLYDKEKRLSLCVAGSGGTALDYDIQQSEELKKETLYLSANFGFVTFRFSREVLNIVFVKSEVESDKKMTPNFEVSINRSGERV